MLNQDASSPDKLNAHLSTYLSCAHISRTLATLPPSSTETEDTPILLQNLSQGYVSAPASSPPKPKTTIIARKPIAGSTVPGYSNTDNIMLGELHVTTQVFHFQGISDLLPQIQKAPENISGESSMCYQHNTIQDTTSTFQSYNSLIKILSYNSSLKSSFNSSINIRATTALLSFICRLTSPPSHLFHYSISQRLHHGFSQR
jgi:hypothetical protein